MDSELSMWQEKISNLATLWEVQNPSGMVPHSTSQGKEDCMFWWGRGLGWRDPHVRVDKTRVCRIQPCIAHCLRLHPQYLYPKELYQYPQHRFLGKSGWPTDAYIFFFFSTVNTLLAAGGCIHFGRLAVFYQTIKQRNETPDNNESVNNPKVELTVLSPKLQKLISLSPKLKQFISLFLPKYNSWFHFLPN